MTNIDFIGDIHGHADALEALLKKLGYSVRNGAWRHPGRQVVFVGDYIDRGPDNPRVIDIVRRMVDAGQAIALCGNHEHNAVCFNTPVADGYLRPHTIKNFNQHARTMQQFLGRQSDYDEAVEWFRTLPLYLETPHFRAVHASWDDRSIRFLRENTDGGVLSDEQYLALADPDSELFHAVEITCKGKETLLPDGSSFLDKDGTERCEIRIKWWLDPQNRSVREMCVVEGLVEDECAYATTDPWYYDEDQKPVFFGHYWLRGEPNLYRDNVCCLDYSVAKEGYLCAYRYSGEEKLDNANLIFV